jgi:biotin synthase
MDLGGKPIVDMRAPFSLTLPGRAGNMRGPSKLPGLVPPRDGDSQAKQRDMRMDHTLLGTVRHDWTLPEVESLFAMPFLDLLFHAQRVHRQHQEPSTVQMSTLLSIKTGACPEDCKYCSQSVRYDTGLERETLLEIGEVVDSARRAKEAGATRFCMGAAYRSPKPKQVAAIAQMIREVRALGMETCATLGMLTPDQAVELKEAGLDYYNHNIDTSPEYYDKVITTRTFQDRLDTLEAVRTAGLKVCCGGILGMGETMRDRAQMLITLANLPTHPESVPINQLVQIPGTPLHGKAGVDPFDFVRVIAVARLMMPGAHVRLSAGREAMSDELQALCFMAGANSMFYGEKLLTTGNPDVARDQQLFARLGLKAEGAHARTENESEAHDSCGHRHAHTLPEPEAINATA